MIKFKKIITKKASNGGYEVLIYSREKSIDFDNDFQCPYLNDFIKAYKSELENMLGIEIDEDNEVFYL